jgi:hypothetical protein
LAGLDVGVGARSASGHPDGPRSAGIGIRLHENASTSVLDIAYEESGPADGRPVVLLHGLPDDIHAYDDVTPSLAAAGYQVGCIFYGTGLVLSVAR